MPTADVAAGIAGQVIGAVWGANAYEEDRADRPAQGDQGQGTSGRDEASSGVLASMGS